MRARMRRRSATMAFVLGLPVMLAVAGTASSGCTDSQPAVATLGEGCSSSIYCDSPLACVDSLCHSPCTTSLDCTSPAKCVSFGGANVCQLTSESTCSPGAPCEPGFVCVANQCRNSCGATVDAAVPCTVAGQTCLQGACYDPGTGPDGGGVLDSGSGGDSGGIVDSTTPSDGAMSDGPVVSNLDAGALGFTPSNFNPGGVSAGDAGAIDAVISTACTNCLPVTATTVMTTSGTLADVYVLRSLIIGQTASLRLSGTNPVILAVLGTVEIQGQLLVNGSTAAGGGPGPGGYSALANGGPGQGQPAFGAANPASNGGGGSYCGLGGSGGAPSGTASGPGLTYGTAAIIPLIGGSAGGTSDANSYGGGALQISAGQSITVSAFGAINAGGSAATNVDGSGGGASGGAILLEAPTVTIAGNLGANGGGGMSGTSGGADATANSTAASGGVPYGGAGSAGTAINGTSGTSGTGANATGGGGGGAGRVRINTSTGSASITGTVSPAMTTACATQGTLN